MGEETAATAVHSGEIGRLRGNDQRGGERSGYITWNLVMELVELCVTYYPVSARERAFAA